MAWLVLKLVFLPIRLAFRAVKLVAATVAGLLGGIAMLALAPVLAVVVGGAAVVAVMSPCWRCSSRCLPFLLLGGLIWAFMRRPSGRRLIARALRRPGSPRVPIGVRACSAAPAASSVSSSHAAR